MRVRQYLASVALSSLGMLLASSAHAVSNRIFMSTNGNNASDCANPLTPCLTFAGALAQVNPGGEVIAEATGGYGPLNIIQAVTISGPPGVVIYSGLGVVINAPGATVVLRGLTIDGTGDPGTGIEIQAAGMFVIEGSVVKSFGSSGVHMGVAGNLIMRNTLVTGCDIGLEIDSISGIINSTLDHCHLDSNRTGFRSQASFPASSSTTATDSSANNNVQFGWVSGAGASGVELLNLEFCSASGNGLSGLAGNNGNSSSVVRFSNCVFSNNGSFGVERDNLGDFQSRVNNTITGNPSGSTSGTINQYLPN